MTCWLYDQLSKRYKVAIISRGYGTTSCLEQPFWIVKGLSQISDEAYMMSGLHRLSWAQRDVVISRKRIEGCIEASAKGYELALLDDGMQHYQIHRDIEIILLDPEDFTQGLLPEGRRREPWSALERADWICVRSAQPISADFKTFLDRFQKPLARLSYTFEGWRSCERLYENGEFLKLKKVGVCAAIARPKQFLKLLKAHQIDIRDECWLADHEEINPEFLTLCEKKWKQQGLLFGICTEKDYARWSQQQQVSDFWIYPILSIRWHEGEKEFLNAVFERVKRTD
jgi:tetraacyldisaccharide 4'-kinase